MKKTILILFLFPVFYANAQDTTSSCRLGIISGISTLAAGMTGPAIHGGASFSSGKHEAYITAFFVNSVNDIKGNYPGFGAGYHFYPNGANNRFSLLFSYDFEYFSAKPEIALTGPSNLPVAWGRPVFEIENYLGFGFRLNILKNLFLTSSIGVGAGKVEERMYYRYSDGRINYWGTDYNETFSLNGKLSLTYNFLELKKQNK